MLIAFRRPQPGSILDWLIAKLDGNGPFCHVQIILDLEHGTAFAAESGMGCDWCGTYTPRGVWETLDIPMDHDKAVLACRCFAGDRYSYWGVICFVLRKLGIKAKPSPGGWFCSELAVRIITLAVQHDGPTFGRDYMIGPNEAYWALKEFLQKKKAIDPCS